MKIRIFCFLLLFIIPLFAQKSAKDSEVDSLDQLINDLVKASEKEKQEKNKPERQVKQPKKGGSSKKIIVIDPGHGGSDPGTVDGKVYEKDITLKLSKKIENLSKKYKNLEVILTRDKDTALDSDKNRDLEKRAKIANEMGADLFISIHVNAVGKGGDKSIRGMEIYHLDDTRDDYSDKLARVENRISENNNTLQTILVDMALNCHVGSSLDYAKEIAVGMKRDLKKYDVKMRSYEKGALFLVLVGARMPSLLFEIGYITNKTERELLQKDEYLEAIAKSLLDSISSSKVK
ncbi:N-acetylmuramoyl-L-alanine amidase [bacterium]|nr:N-acetylmuramoyl-L-alanine amidase [bacterium]